MLDDLADPDDEPHGERTLNGDPGFLNIPGRVNMYKNGMLMPRICRVCGKRQLRFMPIAVRCWYCDIGHSSDEDAIEAMGELE